MSGSRYGTLCILPPSNILFYNIAIVPMLIISGEISKNVARRNCSTPLLTLHTVSFSYFHVPAFLAIFCHLRSYEVVHSDPFRWVGWYQGSLGLHCWLLRPGKLHCGPIHWGLRRSTWCLSFCCRKTVMCVPEANAILLLVQGQNGGCIGVNDVGITIFVVKEAPPVPSLDASRRLGRGKSLATSWVNGARPTSSSGPVIWLIWMGLPISTTTSIWLRTGDIRFVMVNSNGECALTIEGPWRNKKV